MTIKVDVAIQSYMKSESLLYALMTLKEHSEDLIDAVYINDGARRGKFLKNIRRIRLQAILTNLNFL